MSGIDKTYCSWEQYLVLKEWCENTQLVYDNGVIGSPSDFLYLYDEPYEGEACVWNTPTSFDHWLYHNCPLSFIQERLREQYNDPEKYFNEPKPEPETGTHYIILSKPKYNFRYNKTWFIDIDKCNWYYGWDSKIWYPFDKLMPSEIRGSSACIKNLTKRKLNRLVKKWKLPVGTILKICNRYIGTDYTIKIVK